MRRLMQVLAVLTALGAAHVVVADPWHDRERERMRMEEEMRRREMERHRWAMEHPVYHEVVAPAPVVYAPPPPSPGISIVLPIHFH